MARSFFVRALWFFSRELRQTTLTNARRLAGPGSTLAAQSRLARATIGNFLQFVIDLGRTRHMTADQMRCEIAQTRGREYFEQAKAMGRGVIIATAHFGSFEIGIASLTQHAKQVHVLYRPDPFPNFETLRAETRRQLGVVEHDVDLGVITWMKLREALAREEIVLIQADRAEPGQSGQAVPFFDGHLCVPTGPVRLALLTGAPIVPAFSFRDHDNLVQIHLGQPMLVSEQPAPPGTAVQTLSPQEALLKFTRQLEIHVRQHPDQWLMLQPAWLEDQSAPPGIASDHHLKQNATEHSSSGDFYPDSIPTSQDQALI